MEITFFLRKPIFPLICDLNGTLFVALSDRDFIHKLSIFKLDDKAKYDIIDFSGKGWKLDCNLKAIIPYISPLAKKRWSKRALIELYNSRHNADFNYSTKSLSNKRYEMVFMDLVELIAKIEK